MARVIYYPSAAVAQYDADVSSYISRVETADGASLPTAFKDALNTLILALKNNESLNAGVSNFAALRQLIIPAGPATVAGCMIPFLTTMPTATALGTAGGWNINRKTGLQGNGTNNYINLGLGISGMPLSNRFHGGYFALDNISGNRAIINNRDASNLGSVEFAQVNGPLRSTNAYSQGSLNITLTVAQMTGFFGSTRINTAQQLVKIPNVVTTAYVDDATSVDISAGNYLALASVAGTSRFSTHRAGLIGIGNAVNMDTFATATDAFIAALSSITF